ncbi:MAG TPA: hypothetical protein V6D47_15280 [Oscillatoriaceae cyanobacterium]
MSKINLDMKLVAQGYDTNKNGRVDDELNVGNTGIKTVDDLANALSNDQVVISNGSVIARGPGQAPVLSDVKDMQNIQQITGQALTWGGPDYPGYQYQYTAYKTETTEQQVMHTRKDGSTYYTNEKVKQQVPYTAYHWGTAIQDIRARLDSVAAITANPADDREASIHNIAALALQQNNWDFALDEGSSHTRYIALYVALQNINQMCDAPAQPATTIDNLNGAVNGAENALNDLRNTLGSSSTRAITDKQVNDRVAQENKAANSIPFWKKMLVVGLVEKKNHEDTAKRLQQDLSTLRSANPNGIQSSLASVAKSAYETNTSSWSARNINDATRLAQQAQPVQNAASGLQSQASSQSKQILDLSKTLAGK